MVTGFDNIEHASLTDVGFRRSHNQDNHAILLASEEEQWRTQGHLFLVADGMGAHAVGEMASELAAGIIPHAYHKQARQTTPAQALRKAFIEANSSIHHRGQRNREFEGMGTTSTALLLRPEGVWIAHVGDSRAYRIRDGSIQQLSFDHSLVWEYARRQRFDPDQVQGIPSNVIVRSLGPEPLVQVDIEGPHPWQEGDVYVLCSDGLSGPVSDNEIGAVANVLPPAEACRFLVDLANLRGGPDNITVMILRVGNPGATKTHAVSPRRTWALVKLIPRPLIGLFLGLVLVGSAGWRKLTDQGGVALAFALGAIAFVAGLIGLIAQAVREHRDARQGDDSEFRRIQIYSESPCGIDMTLLDKLVRAVSALRQHVVDKQWEAEFETCDAHQKRGAQFLTQGDLVAAFREYCRSMRPLTEALQRQRNKEEVFQPLWDRGPGRASNTEGNGNGTSWYQCFSCGKTVSAITRDPGPTCCDKPMKKIR
jgi:PPM family protein phosphatase